MNGKSTQSLHILANWKNNGITRYFIYFTNSFGRLVSKGLCINIKYDVNVLSQKNLTIKGIDHKMKDKNRHIY